MNNSVFIYEDTFINLLNLIFYLVNHNIKPADLKNTYYNPNLLDKIVNLKIDNDEEIFNKVINLMGIKNFRLIYYVFLSIDINKELIIFYFILNAFKYKHEIIYHRNLKCVCKVFKISHYVMHEIHKYKGFIRFKELENHILYAEISPENDVLSLISNHFKKRLKDEYWIIKDEKRRILSIYDKKKYYIVSLDNFKLNNILLSKNELEIENLWKTFYKTIGIKERKNEKVRRNFMPKKYWKYIIEMENEL